MRARLRAIVLIAAALPSGAALAKHIYEYTDANGIRHFTDIKPPDTVTGVKSELIRAEQQPLIGTRADGTGRDRQIVFINAAGGPVSVQVSIKQAENVRTIPPLPARFVIAPLGETPGVRVLQVDPKLGYKYRFSYTYVPGDYRAHYDPNATYALPFPAQDRFPVSQGFNGKFSHHDDQNRYAVDIVMPVGTPVRAARDGVVMTVANDFYGAGLNMAEYGDRANNIRILHSDGSMAVYAHLRLESARVQVGDHVHAGQVLALSGDTGYTNGPHLHFCVQVNDNMKLVSVPFQFTGFGGTLTPKRGMILGGN